MCYTPLKRIIISVHLLCASTIFFLGKEVHARMCSRSCNSIIHATPRHAKSDIAQSVSLEICHHDKKKQKQKLPFARTQIVNDSALRRAASIPAAHPTHSVVNNTDFPAVKNAEPGFSDNNLKQFQSVSTGICPALAVSLPSVAGKCVRPCVLHDAYTYSAPHRRALESGERNWQSSGPVPRGLDEGLWLSA